MINKEKFIKIIESLKETDDLVTNVNQQLKGSRESKISNGMNAASLMICHEDIVVDLLQDIFNDKDIINYWLYELNYGRKYKKGCITKPNGKIIDISNSGKLYDYLKKVG